MARKIPMNMPIHQGWNILWFRSLNDWSQKDLERETGISQRDISDYEKTSVIPDDILQKFADAFLIDLMYLRDVASYASVESIYMFDQAQVFKNPENVHNNPLDAVREIYEANIARLIESNNKLTYNLEKQIEELKEELRNK